MVLRVGIIREVEYGTIGGPGCKWSRRYENDTRYSRRGCMSRKTILPRKYQRVDGSVRE